MYLVRFAAAIVLISGCLAGLAATPGADRSSIPELVPVGLRGWFSTTPPYAEFEADSPHVEIWIPTPKRKRRCLSMPTEEWAIGQMTARVWRQGAFQAFKGAGEGVLEAYERDVFSFVNRNLVQ